MIAFWRGGSWYIRSFWPAVTERAPVVSSGMIENSMPSGYGRFGFQYFSLRLTTIFSPSAQLTKA